MPSGSTGTRRFPDKRDITPFMLEANLRRSNRDILDNSQAQQDSRSLDQMVARASTQIKNRGLAELPHLAFQSVVRYG